MRNIILILIRFKNTLIFLSIEIVCLWLMVNFNHFPRSNWLHTSNTISGGVNETTSDVSNYFALADKNEDLIQENAFLLQQLKTKEKKEHKLLDSIRTIYSNTYIDSIPFIDAIKQDTSYLKKLNVQSNYSYVPATVIKNKISGKTNFLTLNKGSEDNIIINSGVITANGIVGEVVYVSSSYCLVKSVLHNNNSISIKLKNNQTLGSMQWEGPSIKETTITDIPRHVSISKGDTVITSEFNSVYPANYPIGTVDKIFKGENDAFYVLNISLFTDFTSLNHVYIYKNLDTEEIINLQNKKSLVY